MLTYNSQDRLSVLSEALKFTYYLDSKQQLNGSHFIQEHVNGEFYRYYELQSVQNRPYFMRITLFTRVSPQSFNVRGRDAYRYLNSLRNYIS